MSNTQQGQCHCGDIKLSFPKDATFKFACHCDTCKRLVSGGRLLGFGIPADSLSITGNVSEYSYSGGSGKPITLSFCPKCSAQVFARPEAIDNTIVIRSNALENLRNFEPDDVLFPEKACKWEQI